MRFTDEQIRRLADALLTDFPLECRRLWREPAKP